MQTREQFVISARDAAAKAGHIWPEYAACEAALESNFGTSKLATEGNNLFGRKQSHAHPVYDTVSIATMEYVNGDQYHVMAQWVKYPDIATCFSDRMDTLRRLRTVYTEYNDALHAPDGYTFVCDVSHRWSTDPDRAKKVLYLYATFKRVL